MAKFTIKNLPKGFVYIVPASRIRPFVKQCKAGFITIDYDGVSISEQNVAKWELKFSRRSFHLGILYSHEDETNKEWKFRLKLNGVREMNLPNDPEEIAAKLLIDIETRINNIVALPPTASRNVEDLFFGYRMDMETREAEYSSFIPS